MLLPKEQYFKQIDRSFFGQVLSENGVSTNIAEENFQVFDDSTLERFWNENFHNNGKRRKIPDEFWMFKASTRTQVCNWTEALKAGDSNSVSACLRNHSSRQSNTQMCFFGGVEIVLLEWQAFVEFWNSFVEFNDEGLLAEIESESGLIISPHGYFIDISSL